MDIEPFTITENHVKSPILLLCEHASCYVPTEYKDLGVSSESLESHYGWDIGAYDVFSEMVSQLELTGVHSNISRLLIDANRNPHANDLIREELDPGEIIPGNYQISPEEKKHRLAQYWEPFHRAVDDQIHRLLDRNLRPYLVSIHSFTPVLNGDVRDLEVGLLFHPDYNRQQDNQQLVEALSQKGYKVELNKPYSVENPDPYPIHHYAKKYELSYWAIEINNKTIGDPSQAKQMGLDLAESFQSFR